MNHAEHLDGMSAQGDAPTTTLNSALDEEQAAMDNSLGVSPGDPMPNISEENVTGDMQLDPELGQMHEVEHRDDQFYDPSVDQTGPASFLGELDNNPPVHMPQNINDIAPTPLATVAVDHQTLAGNGNGTGNEAQQHATQQDEDDEQDNKRRRVQRACDACRRKKIRCDGAQAGKANYTCSNCLETKIECTYVEAAKRRGPPPGYIEALEWKVQKFEELVARIKPELNQEHEVGPPINREEFDLQEFKHTLSSLAIEYQLHTGRSRTQKSAASVPDRSSARRGKNPPMNLPNRSLASAADPPNFPVHSQAEVDAVLGLLGQNHDNDPRHQRKIYNPTVVLDDNGRLTMSNPESPSAHAEALTGRTRSHSAMDGGHLPSGLESRTAGGADDTSNANYQARLKEADEAEAQENHDFGLEISNSFPEEGYRFHGKSCTPSTALPDA
ncbi:hypothetical protein NliqN6_6452 [Naganishia liquefaciens]|uniref:Zn(2)-C6 fungal-type domain-containing protein n=1 Tax=Naganishia liquefaciens TaxID=104408 RepID=A0A8H3TZG1_9TREE|nr:hypothetical protein NliqN6_6452 [Naganishia liquefaciens]